MRSVTVRVGRLAVRHLFMYLYTNRMTNATRHPKSSYPPRRTKFVPGTSRDRPRRATVSLDWLMEEAQKLAIAERLRELDKRSPWTQKEIAAKLHIETRSYQKMLKEGTTKRERCVEMARIHSKWAKGSPDYPHVTADWIWDGRMSGAETPDLMGTVDSTELRQVLEELRAVRSILRTEAAKNAELRTELEQLAESLRRRANEG